MPTLVWLSLTALLYDRTAATCVAFAEALPTVSHDRLTRLLQADWSGQRLLELTFRTLFVVERGYLIIDDTVIPKPFATAVEGVAWVYARDSPRLRKTSSGVCPNLGVGRTHMCGTVHGPSSSTKSSATAKPTRPRSYPAPSVHW
jgi:hypothetical protein